VSITLAAVIVVCGWPHRQALGQYFLNVDFNSNDGRITFSPTSNGPPIFSSFDVPSSTGAVSINNTFATDPFLTSGATTVTLFGDTGNISSRDRANSPSNGGSFTFGDLYRDFVVADNDSETITIGLSGLNANTQYQVVFYAYDADHNVHPSVSGEVAEVGGGNDN